MIMHLQNLYPKKLFQRIIKFEPSKYSFNTKECNNDQKTMGIIESVANLSGETKQTERERHNELTTSQ